MELYIFSFTDGNVSICVCRRAVEDALPMGPLTEQARANVLDDLDDNNKAVLLMDRVWICPNMS